MESEGHVTSSERYHGKQTVFEPEYGKLMLERMVIQSGAKLLYGVQIVGCEIENGLIKNVVAYAKTEKLIISADMFIDTTGDADLAVAADVPYESGSMDFGGFNQGSSLIFRSSIYIFRP